MKLTCTAVALLALLWLPAAAQAPAAAGTATAPAHAPLRSGIDTSSIDPAVRPQDDLFQAVNGRWLKATAIPADKAEYGTFVELGDRADQRVRALVEALAAGQHTERNARKVGEFYRSHMDEAAIEAAGLAPVQPWLQRIDAAQDGAALARLLGALQGLADTPLQLYVGADDKDPSTYRLQAWQGGLGLPDRDYYLKNDARFAKARAAYLRYLRLLLQAAGSPEPEAEARAVYALEKRLAQAQWSRVELRDPLKLYNPMTPAQLAQRAPGLDWAGLFEAGALPPLDRLIAAQPSYLQALARSVQEVPLSTWRAYLKVHLLDSQAEVLPRALRDAHFAFHGRTIAGLTADKPRWQKAIKALDTALGEAVGQVYVQQHFPPAYKARMQQLVDHLLAAYRESIDGLSWMSAETQQHARAKLDKIITKIGYPEVWRDYARLEVRAGDAFGNRVRAGRFEHERLAARAGQPVDRREWFMSPQTVNAYYNPNFNEIVFPAAILEPPFFDMGADDAVNYGAIGAVIGHEISHAFDDQGSQYDGDGQLTNWWTAADRQAFDRLGAQLVAQFSRYQPLPGKRLNGRLTLGENIADLSGLQIAYKAWQRSLKGQPAPVIDGLSGEQRFFMGWAQGWREKSREQRALQLLTIDPHSPPRFRANGAVINHDGFHQAFGTQPGDKMFKPAAARIRIW